MNQATPPPPRLARWQIGRPISVSEMVGHTLSAQHSSAVIPDLAYTLWGVPGLTPLSEISTRVERLIEVKKKWTPESYEENYKISELSVWQKKYGLF